MIFPRDNKNLINSKNKIWIKLLFMYGISKNLHNAIYRSYTLHGFENFFRA